MIVNGILCGCALIVIAGVKIFGKFLFQDPCEGSGNFHDPIEFRYNEEDDEESQNK